MFTGIINHIGTFKTFQKGKSEMVITVPNNMTIPSFGESIAVNGVCLSLLKKEKFDIAFNVSEETLKKSNLNSCRRGDKLNLELPLTPSSRLNGHIVLGHVDRTEKTLRIIPSKTETRMVFSLSSNIRSFFIEKGSVAINGISLTVAKTDASSFEVSVIPLTLSNTNLSQLKRGHLVNIESDIIGKYIYNWIKEKKE